VDRFAFVTGNKAYSSWSMRPWLALKHTGAWFEEIVLPLYVPGYKEKLLQHSPAGKVPVLKLNGLTIWDSLAICEYLAERFPKAGLWPEDSATRAQARAASAEMHSGFPVIRRDMPFNCRATDRHVPQTPALQAELKRIQTMWNDFRERHYKAGAWLFGRFSIVDCMYIPVALRFVTYGVSLEGPADEYVRSVQQHPPVREWIAAAGREKEVLETSEVGR
jgi:glutathione S-transferase